MAHFLNKFQLYHFVNDIAVIYDLRQPYASESLKTRTVVAAN